MSTPNVPAARRVTALDVEVDKNAPLDLDQLTPNTLRWLSGILSQSGFFKDAGDPAKAAAKIIFGRELGLTIGESLTGLHIVQGRPTLGATIMAGLIMRSGIVRYTVAEETSTGIVLEWKRRIDGDWVDVGTSKYTLDDAKRAGLANKESWKAYTADMLFARALTRGARRYAADTLGGNVGTPEEAAELPSELEQRDGEADPALRAQGWPPTGPKAAPNAGAAPPMYPDREIYANDQPTAAMPRVEQVIPVRPGITYDPTAPPELAEGAGDGGNGDEVFIHKGQESIFVPPAGAAGSGETEPA